MHQIEIPSQGNIGVVYFDERETADFPAGERRIVRSVLRRISDYGRAAILWRGEDDPGQEQLERLVRSKFMAGLLTVGPVPRGYLEKIRTLNIPAALVNHPDEEAAFDICRPDGYNAGRLAARTLFERGHRRLDYYHFNSPGADENLLNGFYESLVAYSNPPQIQVHTVSFEEVGPLFKERLSAKEPPTAAFLYWEDAAPLVQRLLYEAGMTPGKDFSLIFAGEFIEDEVRPRPHTTVAYDCDQVAYKALEMLLRRIENSASPRAHFKAEYLYVEGETCKTVPGQPVRPEYANQPTLAPDWDVQAKRSLLSRVRGLQVHFRDTVAFLDSEPIYPTEKAHLPFDSYSVDRILSALHVWQGTNFDTAETSEKKSTPAPQKNSVTEMTSSSQDALLFQELIGLSKDWLWIIKEDGSFVLKNPPPRGLVTQECDNLFALLESCCKPETMEQWLEHIMTVFSEAKRGHAKLILGDENPSAQPLECELSLFPWYDENPEGIRKLAGGCVRVLK